MEGWRWRTERKERRKANGFMVTVIIRLAENHFISHRAEGMLGNGFKQVFQCSEALEHSEVSVSVCVCRHVAVLNMKGASGGLDGLHVIYY